MIATQRNQPLHEQLGYHFTEQHPTGLFLCFFVFERPRTM
jgi:hypothetical protein